MKRSELIFNLISIPTDIAAITGAGLVAFYLRLHSHIYNKPVLYHLTRQDFVNVAIRVIPILLIIFGLLGLYNLRSTRRFIHEFNRIAVGVSLGMLLVVVLFFFNQSAFP